MCQVGLDSAVHGKLTRVSLTSPRSPAAHFLHHRSTQEEQQVQPPSVMSRASQTLEWVFTALASVKMPTNIHTSNAILTSCLAHKMISQKMFSIFDYKATDF